MPAPLSAEEIDRLARRRAGAKLGWYFHAAVYVAINVFIFLMSYHAFGTRPWSPFPLIGWGVGVALHGISVFVLGKGSGLRERMVQKERERLEREQQGRT